MSTMSDLFADFDLPVVQPVPSLEDPTGMSGLTTPRVGIGARGVVGSMSASESAERLNYEGLRRNVVDFDMQEAPRGGSSQSTSATGKGFVKPKGRSPSGKREMKLLWMDEPAGMRICCCDLTSMGGVAKFCAEPIVPGQSFCTLLSNGTS
jgi:hypothetical protein